MAIPLIDKGYDIHLIASKAPTYYEQYSTTIIAPTVRQYLRAIELHKDVDLFHVHNEPSWYVTAVKEHSDKPVILDVHDSYLARMTSEEADKTESMRVSHEERTNFQLADGLVFVSEPFRDIIVNEFKLDQPNMVLPSYVPDFFYQYESPKKQWHGGLVYEGRVDLPSQVEKDAGFKYCDYLELAKELKWKGIDFHLYSGRPLTDTAFTDAYKDFALIHEPKSVKNLLPNIARHDWGLIGNINKTQEWNVALPNKLFEYIAASIPIVVMNAAHVAEIVKKYDIGIVVDSVDELAERWPEHREKRANLIKVRKQFLMNNHIHKLEDFYKSCLA